MTSVSGSKRKVSGPDGWREDSFRSVEIAEVPKTRGRASVGKNMSTDGFADILQSCAGIPERVQYAFERSVQVLKQQLEMNVVDIKSTVNGNGEFLRGFLEADRESSRVSVGYLIRILEGIESVKAREQSNARTVDGTCEEIRQLTSEVKNLIPTLQASCHSPTTLVLVSVSVGTDDMSIPEPTIDTPTAKDTETTDDCEVETDCNRDPEVNTSCEGTPMQEVDADDDPATIAQSAEISTPLIESEASIDAYECISPQETQQKDDISTLLERYKNIMNEYQERTIASLFKDISDRHDHQSRDPQLYTKVDGTVCVTTILEVILYST